MVTACIVLGFSGTPPASSWRGSIPYLALSTPFDQLWLLDWYTVFSHNITFLLYFKARLLIVPLYLVCFLQWCWKSAVKIFHFLSQWIPESCKRVTEGMALCIEHCEKRKPAQGTEEQSWQGLVPHSVIPVFTVQICLDIRCPSVILDRRHMFLNFSFNLNSGSCN